MSNDEAPIRTVNAFHKFMDALPLQWTDNGKWQLRFWSIDADGRVGRIEAHGLDVGNRNLAIDSLIFAAAIWCKRYHPPAVVVCSETWTYHMEEDVRVRMQRELGGTPNLSDDEIRADFSQRYGVPVTEALMVYGEIASGPEVHRFYDIAAEGAGKRLQRRAFDPGVDFTSKFQGIRQGTPRVLEYYGIGAAE
jgi:hypothetical protein